MNLSKKLLALLAIFCIIASVGIVCAAEDGGNAGTDVADGIIGTADDMTGLEVSDNQEDGGYAGSQYQDDGGYAGSQYNESEENGGWAGSQYNETAENAFAANQTAQNATNATAPIAGNTTTNDTNATALHNMLATGNPVLALFAVCAVLGGFAVFRKKE